jgi:hypothetical protein
VLPSDALAGKSHNFDLKTLCGFGVPAIARALLTTEATVNKRLYRTRTALRGVQFELPAAADLPAARETVHTALYLLFNEGYFSTTDKPILRELCRDAMLLTGLLAEHPAIATSDTIALIALMCFNAARLESRLDDEGHLVPLDQQDRSRWEAGLIRSGFVHLAQSAEMDAVMASRYHLEPRLRRGTARGDIREDGLGVDLSPLRPAPRGVAIADGRAEPRGRGVISRQSGRRDSAGRGARQRRHSLPQPCRRRRARESAYPSRISRTRPPVPRTRALHRAHGSRTRVDHAPDRARRPISQATSS